MRPPADAVDRAWREERATVLATVARRVGDLQLAEDAVQEAFVAAATHWPRSGVPDRPGAWLTTTAWRKAIGILRRTRPTSDLSQLPDAGSVDGAFERAEADLQVDDDLLGLVLTCCHPSLAPEARVALTLRHVAGLTAREIAAGFLVPEVTMAKRLVRARAKIRDAGISFEPPDHPQLADRLGDVHAVIYLVFTEGHLASGDGEPVRAELCDDAVWLARQLHRIAPDDHETTGLLALLLVQHSRAGARHDGTGLVSFEDQDRSRWDAGALAEARLLLAATGRGQMGPYQIQAAIALLHAAAPDAAGIDWPRIAQLYGILTRLDPSPVIEVNRALAVGRADGPLAGLAALEPVIASGRLASYASLHAARADLLGRAGHEAAADEAWRLAAHLADNPAHRAALLRRVR